MNVLFTPWRFPYLTSPKSEQPAGCIFCIAAASGNDRETLTIYRGERPVVMLNKYPYTNGRVMVAPIAHEALLMQSSDASLRALIPLTAEARPSRGRSCTDICSASPACARHGRSS